MGKYNFHAEIVSDKEDNPVTRTKYIKHDDQWLDEFIDTTFAELSEKINRAEGITHSNLHIAKHYKPSWSGNYKNYYDECCVYNKSTSELMVFYQAVDNNDNVYAVVDTFDKRGNIIKSNAYNFQTEGVVNSGTYDDNTNSIILCFTGDVEIKKRYNPITMQFIENFNIDDYPHVIWDEKDKVYITYDFSPTHFFYKIYEPNKTLISSYEVALDEEIRYWGMNQAVAYNHYIYATLNGQLYRFDLNGNYISKSAASMFELEGLTIDENDEVYFSGHISHNDVYFYVGYYTEEPVRSNLGMVGDNSVYFEGNLNKLFETGIFRCSPLCENKPHKEIDSEFFVVVQGIYDLPDPEYLGQPPCIQIAFSYKPRCMYFRWGASNEWGSVPFTTNAYNTKEGIKPTTLHPEQIEFTGHSIVQVDNGTCNICAELYVKSQITSANNYFITDASVVPLPKGIYNDTSSPNEYYFPMFAEGSSESYTLGIGSNGIKIIEKSRPIPVGYYYINITYPVPRA